MSRERFKVYKVKCVFVAIMSIFLFAACSTEENAVKVESQSIKHTEDLGTVNNSIFNNSVTESGVTDAAVSDNIDILSEDVDAYKNYSESTIALIESAKAGDIDSMNTLAYYYFNGYEVEQDYEKSLEWSLKSAEGGNLASMFNVGYNYYYGYAGEVNYDLSLKWYEKAAKEMYPKALNALGQLYYKGLGVEKNIDKALEYTLQSAGFLHNYSLSNMGTVIEEEHLEGDSNDWYRLAAKNYLIRSSTNSKLYENLKNGVTGVKVDYSLKDTDIPLDLIEDIMYKYYSGTLYDYLEVASKDFMDFDINDFAIQMESDHLFKPMWWYDRAYLVDLNNDSTDELITYIMEGTGGGISFNIFERVNNVYVSVNDMQKYFMDVGINGVIAFEDQYYFVVANVDIGNRIIYSVNIYSFSDLQIDESVTIEIKEVDTNFMKTYQLNESYDELNVIVEAGIDKMFQDKWGSMLYKNVNESMVVDSDINNDGDIEHYEYESIFWGTINHPISIEFKETNSEEDMVLINAVLSFNDLGLPLGIEIFTLEGINYIGVLSYEMGTNNHCLTTFRLQDGEATVVLNHLITFKEKIIVK